MISKVKAHANIDGNEQADQLAKAGNQNRNYQFATKPHEFAHTTPYYFQKDTWPSPRKRPDKGPVRCLETYITKFDRENNLEILAEQFSNINKWTTNPSSIIQSPITSGPIPSITNSQKTNLLKFRTGQYMGQCQKTTILWNSTIPLKNMSYLHTRKTQTHGFMSSSYVNNTTYTPLRTKRHNKAVWEIRKLILSSNKSRCYTLMNAGTFNNNPPRKYNTHMAPPIHL